MERGDKLVMEREGQKREGICRRGRRYAEEGGDCKRIEAEVRGGRTGGERKNRGRETEGGERKGEEVCFYIQTFINIIFYVTL